MTRIGFCSFCNGTINIPDGEEYHFWDYFYRQGKQMFHRQMLIARRQENSDTGKFFYVPFSVRCIYNQPLLVGGKNGK